MLTCICVLLCLTILCIVLTLIQNRQCALLLICSSSPTRLMQLPSQCSWLLSPYLLSISSIIYQAVKGHGINLVGTSFGCASDQTRSCNATRSSSSACWSHHKVASRYDSLLGGSRANFARKPAGLQHVAWVLCALPCVCPIPTPVVAIDALSPAHGSNSFSFSCCRVDGSQTPACEQGCFSCANPVMWRPHIPAH